MGKKATGEKRAPSAYNEFMSALLLSPRSAGTDSLF